MSNDEKQTDRRDLRPVTAVGRLPALDADLPTCPACTRPVRAGVAYCPWCQHHTGKLIEPLLPPQTVLHCHSCGSVMICSDDSCGDCGEPDATTPLGVDSNDRDALLVRLDERLSANADSELVLDKSDRALLKDCRAVLGAAERRVMALDLKTVRTVVDQAFEIALTQSKYHEKLSRQELARILFVELQVAGLRADPARRQLLEEKDDQPRGDVE